MPPVFTEKLSDKAVMGSDGTELGTLYNITMDPASGQLLELIINPKENTTITTPFDVDENGRYRVPVQRVQALKDYIVVDSS